MLLEKIKRDLVSHIKSGDKTKISIIRLLLAALKDKEISLRNSDGFDELLDDNVVMEIINKMIKQRKVAVKAYMEAKRLDLAEKEKLEASFLTNYLPMQLSEPQLGKEIDQLINKLKANSLRDMSKVIKVLKDNFNGQCDFKLASDIVKKKLSGRS